MYEGHWIGFEPWLQNLVILMLTEYCLEEFEKFTTFLTISGEIGQFSE